MKKAIVVEDNMLISVLYRHFLKKLNYNIVAETMSGEKAVSIIREQPADLIIMDIMLDGEMNGIEVVQKIRKTINTPVIFATGNSDEKTRKKALDLKYAEFLVKPVDMNEFTKAIRRLEKSHMVA